MDWPPSGSTFIFGPMAWLGYLVGFLMGCFILKPHKLGKKYYTYWKEKEDAAKERRKAKRTANQFK